MHVISGQIRKKPYTKDGVGNKGPYTLIVVEMSERVKDKDGNNTYTNYSAAFFANEKQKPYYLDWLSEGKFVSITAESLLIDQRDSNGQTYITLKMVNPRLAAFQSSQQGQQQSWGQPQQPQQQQQQQQRQQPQQQQQNSPPMDFDDDIPF